MMDVEYFVHEIARKRLVKVVLSNPVGDFRKMAYTQDKNGYFIEKYTQTQVFHAHVGKDQLEDHLISSMNDFKQLNAFDDEHEYSLKKSKKGKVFTAVQGVQFKHESIQSQNRTKSSLLPEGTIIEPLIDMGIMNKEGAILKDRQDKYRQINRYLEILTDVLKDEETIRMVDFGCGKSYLTFIVYYYFHEVLGKNISIYGIDLKKEVIAFCQKTADKYGYDGLKFYCQDIKDFKEKDINVVMSLHACDTATDLVIAQGIKWESKVIMVAPCCQHELNQQIKHQGLLTRYGLLQERLMAGLTDAVRANALIIMGYKTQVMEFVDLTDTPKNILIRAVKTKMNVETKKTALKEIREICQTYQLDPAIVRLLNLK